MSPVPMSDDKERSLVSVTDVFGGGVAAKAQLMRLPEELVIYLSHGRANASTRLRFLTRKSGSQLRRAEMRTLPT
jgi:hypothetical protein